MPTLQSRLNELAESFADAVLDAIRSASLDVLQANGGIVGNGRRARPGKTTASPKKPNGRLPRRSAADIAKVLDQVVAIVKKEKDGMRSEEIRKALNLDVREVPRVLKEGLAKKRLRSKGEKRATTYFAK
jgi:hypothetical protein